MDNKFRGMDKDAILLNELMPSASDEEKKTMRKSIAYVDSVPMRNKDAKMCAYRLDWLSRSEELYTEVEATNDKLWPINADLYKRLNRADRYTEIRAATLSYIQRTYNTGDISRQGKAFLQQTKEDVEYELVMLAQDRVEQAHRDTIAGLQIAQADADKKTNLARRQAAELDADKKRREAEANAAKAKQDLQDRLDNEKGAIPPKVESPSKISRAVMKTIATDMAWTMSNFFFAGFIHTAVICGGIGVLGAIGLCVLRVILSYAKAGPQQRRVFKMWTSHALGAVAYVMACYDLSTLKGVIAGLWNEGFATWLLWHSDDRTGRYKKEFDETWKGAYVSDLNALNYVVKGRSKSAYNMTTPYPKRPDGVDKERCDNRGIGTARADACNEYEKKVADWEAKFDTFFKGDTAFADDLNRLNNHYAEINPASEKRYMEAVDKEEGVWTQTWWFDVHAPTYEAKKDAFYEGAGIITEGAAAGVKSGSSAAYSYGIEAGRSVARTVGARMEAETKFGVAAYETSKSAMYHCAVGGWDMGKRGGGAVSEFVVEAASAFVNGTSYVASGMGGFVRAPIAFAQRRVHGTAAAMTKTTGYLGNLSWPSFNWTSSSVDPPKEDATSPKDGPDAECPVDGYFTSIPLETWEKTQKFLGEQAGNVGNAWEVVWGWIQQKVYTETTTGMGSVASAVVSATIVTMTGVLLARMVQGMRSRSNAMDLSDTMALTSIATLLATCVVYTTQVGENLVDQKMMVDSTTYLLTMLLFSLGPEIKNGVSKKKKDGMHIQTMLRRVFGRRDISM